MYYVIGDVHGCFDEFIALKDMIEKDDNDAKLILVGDIIDRGPKVVDMLNWAIHNIHSDKKYQMVLGNHEEMIIDWYKRNNEYRRRFPFNERKNIRYSETDYDFRESLYNAGLLNKSYLDLCNHFFKKLPLYKEIRIDDKIYIITHASVPIFTDYEMIKENNNTEQFERIFLWSRESALLNYPDNYILIHGHTPTIINREDDAKIFKNNNVINVDCGSVYRYSGYKGRLAAICLNTQKEYYV